TLNDVISRRLAALTAADDAETQQAAVAALGRLGGSDKVTVEALLTGLKDDDAPVRAEAAHACGRLNFVDPRLLPALKQMYNDDPADEARHAALDALLALGRAETVGMVPVAAGDFLMGSAAKEPGAKENEQPQHELYLPAYFIDRTPVTNAQFRRFIEAGGYANEAYWLEAIAAQHWQEGQYIYSDKKWNTPRYWEDKKWNGAEQPVVGVSWYEALAYVRWAGKRLPTEAEWEKAARGTAGQQYPWGNEWQPKAANTEEANIEQTTPVGQFSPLGDSPYGALDMVGNVWEWCSTRWHDQKQKEYNYPYTPDDGREDLSGGDNIYRVLRGGSWYQDKDASRCAARDGYNPRF
ncbi:MAG: SUMF1/EgtB/PvdO family nonheme iron enzyme, partial [Chloroflexi bacterium]|nr:SUMF1/EgtB/PvdO family nonheme iron enzyme [Chloroflexota bacterium]